MIESSVRGASRPSILLLLLVPALAGAALTWPHTTVKYENFQLRFGYKLAKWAEATVILRALGAARPRQAEYLALACGRFSRTGCVKRNVEPFELQRLILLVEQVVRVDLKSEVIRDPGEECRDEVRRARFGERIAGGSGEQHETTICRDQFVPGLLAARDIVQHDDRVRQFPVFADRRFRTSDDDRGAIAVEEGLAWMREGGREVYSFAS